MWCCNRYSLKCSTQRWTLQQLHGYFSFKVSQKTTGLPHVVTRYSITWHYSKVISRTSLKVIKIANDVCFWANLRKLFWNQEWRWGPLEMLGKTRGRCWRCAGEDREPTHPLWMRYSSYSESRNQLQTQALNINAPTLRANRNYSEE